MDSRQDIVAQIDRILNLWRSQKGQAKRSDNNNLDQAVKETIATRLAAAIERFAAPGSCYRRNMDIVYAAAEKQPPDLAVEVRLEGLSGILDALRDDYADGYLGSVTELIHQDLFSDLLEMAQYFMDSGYKDAAAVMAGGVLETHIRKLCEKNELGTADERQAVNTERLNIELARADVYSKLDQKNVTAWLGLRNEAAHAEYDKYSAEQVALMLQGVRDFLTRHPA